ncbi:hypothetical protein Tco_0883717 [Tanacetum coccineum]
MVVQHQEEMGEGSANPTDPYHTPTIIQPSTSQPQKKQKPRRPKRKDTEIPQSSSPTDSVAEKAVNEKMDDSLERAATTATSLDAEQDRGNIDKTQSKATLNEPSSLGTSSGSGPRRQETMGIQLLKLGLRMYLNILMIHCSQEEDASKHGRKIDDIDKDAEITLINETQGRYGDDLMFDTGVLDDEEVFAGHDMDEKEINVAEKEVSTADPVTTAGKGIIEELEKPTKKKDQIRHDEEVSQRLQAQMQAELEEEDRLVRQREEEANIISWDNVQAMIDADYQMAQQRQAEEQEKLSIKEKSKLFVQLLEVINKHFAAIRANEKRNKPPTKAQKINTMSTYLKNIAGYKHNHLKKKSFDDIQKLFDKAMKRQKVDEDKETTELQRLIEFVPDKEEVAIDAIPLATKTPSIVDYKINKEGKKTYYQIIRADVKAKHGSTRLEEGYERVLWGDLKIMFDPYVEDQVWRNQQDYRVLDWKIYDSCGVYSLRMQHMHIHMLVEKRYPLTPATITDMLNKKLQCEYFSEMGRIVRIKRLHDDLEVTAAGV